jgi:carbon-monoxide dehydrogenase medium subunit
MRFQPIAEFVRAPFETTLAPGELIVGFDIPSPQQPFRWGFAKVARKSGAFANSIAIAVSQGAKGPASVVLGAAGPRPALLDGASKHLQARSPDDALLRLAIEADVNLHAPDADGYQKRMHAATILRAIRDMRAQ